MKLHFLKIVWGDVTVLESDGEFALIDTGYDTTFESIREYLDSLGVKKLSFILLSHFHRDHYGSIPALLDAYEVERVYFKEYSGLDKSTAQGTPADDEYRRCELEKCEDMRRKIIEKSTLIPAETTKVILFAGTEIKLYATENRMREVYEDAEYEEYYHKITHGENMNSLVAYLNFNGAKILFGADVTDSNAKHPKLANINNMIAKEIGEKIDVYKVSHHGTSGFNTQNTLDIYKPDIAIITNRLGYLAEKSTVFDTLKRANPDVKIILTELSGAVIDISEKGEITIEKSAKFDTDTGVFSKM